MTPMRLSVNIDHVATLRNARGGAFPCPVEAARLAERIIGRPLGGHVMHAGSLAKYRARAGAAAGHG